MLQDEARNKTYTKMRKIILFISFYFYIFSGISQETIVIDQYLSNVFKKYYKIKDVKSSKYWDYSSSTNVYGNSYHGRNNQQWLIMPVYPTVEDKTEVVFVCRENGRILDRHHSNNIYAFSKYHGGTNQNFEVMIKRGTTNKFCISSDNGKLIDRTGSSEHKDPFKKPNRKKNNLYCQNAHYGTNQQFTFSETGTIPNSHKIKFQTNNVSLQFPPNPMNPYDTGESNTKHSYKVIGKTIIPFFLVKDSYTYSSPATQVKYTPYYILERYRYYKLVNAFHTGSGLSSNIEFTSSVGLTTNESEQIKETLSVEQSMNGSVKYTNDEISSSVSINMSKKLNTETVASTSSTLETSASRTISCSKTIEGAQMIFTYRPVDGYKLYRLNSSTPILSWEVVIDNNDDLLICSSQPSSYQESGSSKSIPLFKQQNPENKIPQMQSNSYPYGRASSSSQYSSSYAAWKAFDKETSWTCWISKNTGSYSSQWLEYQFNESTTITSYNITPQTGNLTNRSPKAWKLQAWNGRGWTTIDQRSNYSTSFWNSKASRDFNIKYPKKYKRFRILITQTNGSTVVSLRYFKLHSPESSPFNKNGITGTPPTNFSMEINTDIRMDIWPNPVQGSTFNIEIANYPIKEDVVIDDTSFIKNEYTEINVLENKIIIELFDLSGKMIYKNYYTSNRIQINEILIKGIYIVKANIDGTIIEKKLIVR